MPSPCTQFARHFWEISQCKRPCDSSLHFLWGLHNGHTSVLSSCDYSLLNIIRVGCTLNNGLMIWWDAHCQLFVSSLMPSKALEPPLPKEKDDVAGNVNLVLETREQLHGSARLTHTLLPRKCKVKLEEVPPLCVSGHHKAHSPPSWP